MANHKKKDYKKPELVKYDSVERLTKAWNVGSDDGDSGLYKPN